MRAVNETSFPKISNKYVQISRGTKFTAFARATLVLDFRTDKSRSGQFGTRKTRRFRSSPQNATLPIVPRTDKSRSGQFRTRKTRRFRSSPQNTTLRIVARKNTPLPIVPARHKASRLFHWYRFVNGTNYPKNVGVPSVVYTSLYGGSHQAKICTEARAGKGGR